MHIIKRFRKKNGMTQTDFAKPLRVTCMAVSHWETGRRTMEPKTARLIELVHGISRKKLLPEIFG